MTSKTGFVYLVQPKEYLGTDCYKIGCSGKLDESRLKAYGSGTIRHIIARCNDYLLFEDDIIYNFNKKFELFRGKEYFRGKLADMWELFAYTLARGKISESDDSESDDGKTYSSSDDEVSEESYNDNSREMDSDDETVKIIKTKSEGGGTTKTVARNLHNSDYYVCGICETVFGDYDVFLSHTKQTCNPVKKFACKYCQKRFSTSSSMYRHAKHSCKERMGNDSAQKMLEKITILENEIAQLKNSHVKMQNMIEEKIQGSDKRNSAIDHCSFGDNNNVNNINNVNNVTYRIELSVYGKEDLGKIENDPELLSAAYEKGLGAAAEITKFLHFNEDYPENHNVYMPESSGGIAKIYDGEKWRDERSSVVAKQLMDKSNDVMLSNLHGFRNSISDEFLSFWCDLMAGNGVSKRENDKAIKGIKNVLYTERHVINRDSDEDINDNGEDEQYVEEPSDEDTPCASNASADESEQSETSESNDTERDQQTIRKLHEENKRTQQKRAHKRNETRRAKPVRRKKAKKSKNVAIKVRSKERKPIRRVCVNNDEQAIEYRLRRDSKRR